jgi:hypothetical protein
MEKKNINLLDLNNDILNIIGEYVKKDNIDRMEKEKIDNYYRRKDEESKKIIFKYVDCKIKEIKRELNVKNKTTLKFFIYQSFADCGIGTNNEMIVEYLTFKKKY